jgi:hypothetical protein
MQCRRLDTSHNFFVRIFKVPEPDAKLTGWLEAQEGPARNHRQGFGDLQVGLADAAGRDRCRDELAQQSPPVKPLPFPARSRASSTGMAWLQRGLVLQLPPLARRAEDPQDRRPYRPRPASR